MPLSRLFLKSPLSVVSLLCLLIPFDLQANTKGDRLWQSRFPISLDGTIRPIETLRVQTSVAGRVTTVEVDENELVKRDQLLLTLKNETQKQQLELARLQLKINQNNLKDRGQQITLAKVQVDTSKNAVKDRERQIKLLDLQVQTSRNNVTDRKRQVKLAKLQLETSRNNLKDRQRQVVLTETLIGISSNSLKDQETNLKDIERRLKDEQTLFEQGSSTKSQLDAVQLQKDRGILAVASAKLNLSRTEQDLNGVKIIIENAHNAVLRSEQDVEGANLALENTRIALLRSEQDIEGGRLALENTRLALMRAEQELIRARLSEENAKLSVKLSEQEVSIREENLGDTYIRSKINGIVISKAVVAGEVVGNGARLFEIINMKRVDIEVLVDEEDLSRIKDGVDVVFTTPSFPNERFVGSIDRVAWRANPQNGMFSVFVHAENPGLRLRSGMSVKVYLTE